MTAVTSATYKHHMIDMQARLVRQNQISCEANHLRRWFHQDTSGVSIQIQNEVRTVPYRVAYTVYFLQLAAMTAYGVRWLDCGVLREVSTMMAAKGGTYSLFDSLRSRGPAYSR